MSEGRQYTIAEMARINLEYFRGILEDIYFDLCKYNDSHSSAASTSDPSFDLRKDKDSHSSAHPNVAASTSDPSFELRKDKKRKSPLNEIPAKARRKSPRLQERMKRKDGAIELDDFPTAGTTSSNSSSSNTAAQEQQEQPMDKLTTFRGEVVYQKVHIWKTKEKLWAHGRVLSYNAADGIHEIEYDQEHREKEFLNLRREQVCFPNLSIGAYIKKSGQQ